jgi:hypothetical protein
MKWVLLLIIGAAILAGSLLAHAAREDRNIDVGLWLARSCVGEAGFASVDSGECAAILHVYKKRARTTKRHAIYKMAQKYSAAIRLREAHPHNWILGLRRNLKEPTHWNPVLRWRIHRGLWKAVLDHADAFLAGDIPDPIPSALHYGGAMDRGRLSRRVWKPIKGLPFQNTFYEARKAKFVDGWLKGYKPKRNMPDNS